MPPSTSSSKPTLSPAELAQLEHAFATDPNSDAYRPLAEAYLAMGRFMEAMVVCKKGVKAHADRTDARVLLARVYAEQNKDKKALEELEGAIQINPKDVPALRLGGALLLKTGENDKGKDYLTRAFLADPKDAETKELLEKWRIEVALPEPPKPPEPVKPPPVLAPAPVPELASMGHSVEASDPGTPIDGLQVMESQPAPQGRTGTSGAQRPVQPQRTGTTGPQAPVLQQAQPRAPQAPRAPQRPQRAPEPEQAALDLSRFEEPDTQRKTGNSGAVTLGFIVMMVVALIGWQVVTKRNKEQKAAIAAALHSTNEMLRADTYPAYRNATEEAEKVLKIDPDSIAGQAFLAYIYAIRWGEHGEGDTSKAQALDHLARAKALKQDHSHLMAAEALVAFYDGNAAQAQSDLEAKVAGLEKQGKASALVYQTLGIIQMRNGDLEKASVSLKRALDLSPAEPRTHAAMGDLYRRQGNERIAINYYENALRYERKHATAVLGETQLVLDSDNIEPAKQMSQSEELLKRVTSSTGESASPRELALAYLLEGVRLNMLGKKDDGKAQEEKALQLDGQNPEIHVLRGRRMIRDGQFKEGLDEINIAIKKDPKRASFYVELARAQMNLPNGAADAIKSLDTALKQLPGSAKLLGLKGDAQQKAGDAKGAQASYLAALAIDPNAKLPDIRLSLATMYRSTKEWDKAQAMYDRAVKELDSNPTKLAEVYSLEGQMAEEKGGDDVTTVAFELYKKALGADANYAPGYFFMGKLLAANKKLKDKGKESLEEYLKKDPKGTYAANAQQLLSNLR
jgi:tetratricopeptide (TPR) repeat protein